VLDLVAGREALGGEELAGRKHSHPDIRDAVLDAGHHDQAKAIAARDRVERLAQAAAHARAVVLHEERRDGVAVIGSRLEAGLDQGVMISGRHCPDRAPKAVADNSAVVLGQKRRHKRVLGSAGHHCAERLLEPGDAWRLPWALSVARLDQGWDCTVTRGANEVGSIALDDIAADPLGDATLSGDGELAATLEDGGAGHRPVNALGGRPVGQATPGAMRGLWPDDRLTVAAGDEEQALSRGRRAVVGGDQRAPLDHIAEIPEVADPGAERLALAVWAWLASDDRPPALELLHVLEHDDARPDLCRPPDHHPREAADMLLARLRALRAAKVGAVGREPRQPDLPTRGGLDRIDIPDRLAVVLRVRMVGPMHSDGVWIVVDGEIHMPPECGLDARRRAAAAGEIVDHELVEETELAGVVGGVGHQNGTSSKPSAEPCDAGGGCCPPPLNASRSRDSCSSRSPFAPRN